MTEKEKGIILNRMRAIESEIVEFPLHGASLRSSLQEYCRLNERSKAFDFDGRCFLEDQYESIKTETLQTLSTHIVNLKYLRKGIENASVKDLLSKLISIRRSTEIINRVTSNLTVATDVFKDGNG